MQVATTPKDGILHFEEEEDSYCCSNLNSFPQVDLDYPNFYHGGLVPRRMPSYLFTAVMGSRKRLNV